MQGGCPVAVDSKDGGAAIEKALSPFVFKRERGTAKKALSEDLRDLEDESGVRWSERYSKMGLDH